MVVQHFRELDCYSGFNSCGVRFILHQHMLRVLMLLREMQYASASDIDLSTGMVQTLLLKNLHK